MITVPATALPNWVLRSLFEGQTVYDELFEGTDGAGNVADGLALLNGSLLDLGVVRVSQDGILDMQINFLYDGFTRSSTYCPNVCYDPSEYVTEFTADSVAFDYGVQSSVVPVPAAVWLFGSGIGLLGWLGRRRKNRLG